MLWYSDDRENGNNVILCQPQVGTVTHQELRITHAVADYLAGYHSSGSKNRITPV